MSEGNFQFAFKQSLPVVLAYFPLGIVFGMLFVHQGYQAYWAPIMSALLYSGAVQFMVLTMLANHAPLTSILIAAFFVAFRNVFYGLSFFERFSQANRLLRSWLIFGLVDGSYAIFLKNPKGSLRFCNQVTWILYLSWVLGTLIGVLCADILPMIKGLDFILPCFFMVLVVDFYLKSRNPLMLIVPVVTAAIGYLLSPKQYLLIAILLCFALTLLVPEKESGHE